MKVVGPFIAAVLATLAAAESATTNASYLPLFPPVLDNPTNTSAPPPLQRLHTSLATLLPILPILSPPPTHTLLVTFATSAFRSLLFNFICFLRYKAKWAAPHPTPGYPQLPHSDVLKLLVVTSEPDFAQELADLGIVVWYLKGTSVQNTVELSDEELELELRDELFINLRLMDLLLPPHPPKDAQRGMFKWGSLHYQSLMLERSVVMATLVGALAESQQISTEERKKAEKEWMTRLHAHDWTKSRIYPPAFVGVKGILVVDNDAVWLSSPAAFLANPYRPNGPHPAVVYAGDNAHHLKNSWGGYSTPCACFFYARTSDDLAATAVSLLPHEADEYRPSVDASLIWRTTALCHIAMLQKALAQARSQAQRMRLGSDEMIDFIKAVAPSFQASALGPSIGLSLWAPEIFERVSHQDFMNVLNSGNDFEVPGLLELLGIGEGKDCIDLVKTKLDSSPNLLHETSLTTPPYRKRRSPTMRVRSEVLPFAIFPPGMSFFAHDQEEGIRPCVVHANYATGALKEELLRKERLWALGKDEVDKSWTCDAQVMANA